MKRIFGILCVFFAFFPVQAQLNTAAIDALVNRTLKRLMYRALLCV